MRTRKIMCGLTFGLASVLSCLGAPTKVATQTWVQKVLAESGIRVSTATVQTNVTATGDGAVQTNITVESAYICPEVTDCTAISFTMSLPSLAYRQVTTQIRRNLWDILIMRTFADGQAGKTVVMVIQSGYWIDKVGNHHAFNLGGGWELELRADKMPSIPFSTHVCTLSEDCNCQNMGLTGADIETPEDYDDITARDFAAAYGSIADWVDLSSWGSVDGQRTSSGPRGTTYWLTDADGVEFNIEKIWESDAMIDAMASTVIHINRHMKDCRDAYVQSQVCTANNPQHRWATTTCGTYTWSECKHNPDHKQGMERHSFPGQSLGELEHACRCGTQSEVHGQLVEDGDRIITVGASGHADGWVQMMVCSKGCGFQKQYVHKHHFVNCGVCDTGDDCEAVCTGCSGAHAFGKKTGTGCARCECEMSEGCVVTPEDITKHSGWEPCGEDAEEDNDWLEAKGGHCRCECRKFGHIARTEHDYQLTAGLERYEQCTGDDRETSHYYRLGTCTRCGQHKKQKQTHNFPEDPTEYRYKSDEVCRWAYLCQCGGCDYIKYVDSHGHSLRGTPSVCENVSISICRWKYECEKCKGLIKDDTHGHERNIEDGCKCKKGCGYQFEHNYVTDACGNKSCSYCKTGKNGVVEVEQHSGYTDTGDVHKCACGMDQQPHSFSAWEVIIRGVGAGVYTRTCSMCGAAEYRTVSESGGTCNTNINLHVPASAVCGCECGHYGKGALTADERDFHKWSAADSAGGVADCRCECGARHEFRVRDGFGCPNVCAYCREVRKDGTRATEADHEPVKRAARRCGCECGYYGVSDEHAAAGRSAADPRLHIQSMENNSSAPVADAAAYCQCYGEAGKGGKRHWQYANAANSCPKVCRYRRAEDALGHRHADGSPDVGIVPATPEDHAGKTDHTGGCGCRCGICSADNAAEWRRNAALHQYNSSQADRCHCACGEKVLCGDTPVDGERHTFPVTVTGTDAAPLCVCTCGGKHRMMSGSTVAKGKCGTYCSLCKRLYRGAWQGDATVAANHVYGDGECKCDCGDFVHPDGHTFAESSCVCKCGGKTLTHLVRATREALPSSLCTSCGASFSSYVIVLECARCDASLGDAKTVYIGAHRNGCGSPDDIQSGCAVCGCRCSGRCAGHYCSACCSSKPDDRPKRPANDPDIPDSCSHTNTGRTEKTERASWTCSDCHVDFRSTTHNFFCAKCGALADSYTEVEGAHGRHEGAVEDGTCSQCGRKDGEHATSCPLYTPTGGGGSGGEQGGGDLKDI